MNTNCLLFIQSHNGPKEQEIARGTEGLEQDKKLLSYNTFYSKECYLEPQTLFLLPSALYGVGMPGCRNIFNPKCSSTAVLITTQN